MSILPAGLRQAKQGEARHPVRFVGISGTLYAHEPLRDT